MVFGWRLEWGTSSTGLHLRTCWWCCLGQGRAGSLSVWSLAGGSMSRRVGSGGWGLYLSIYSFVPLPVLRLYSLLPKLGCDLISDSTPAGYCSLFPAVMDSPSGTVSKSKLSSLNCFRLWNFHHSSRKVANTWIASLLPRHLFLAVHKE